jgi:putative oxidoreductase
MGRLARAEEVMETSNAQAEARPAFNMVCRILALLIGGLFIYAGVVKVLDPVGFAGDIENYKVLPWPIGVRLAFYLPWLEILAGVALIVRRLYWGGWFILTVLMTVFIVATIVAKMRGLDISCGCFGHVSKSFSFAWHLALDFALLGGLLFLWKTPRPNLEYRDGGPR